MDHSNIIVAKNQVIAHKLAAHKLAAHNHASHQGKMGNLATKVKGHSHHHTLNSQHTDALKSLLKRHEYLKNHPGVYRPHVFHPPPSSNAILNPHHFTTTLCGNSYTTW